MMYIQYCTLPTSPAIDMNLIAFFFSTVTAESVRVESIPQTSCLNKPVVFVCMPDFEVVTIRWIHTAFGKLVFSTLNNVGDTTNTSDGRVVASLTMKDANGALLASILTLDLPLNTSLNETNITCEGGSSTITISGFATILLEG